MEIIVSVEEGEVKLIRLWTQVVQCVTDTLDTAGSDHTTGRHLLHSTFKNYKKQLLETFIM